MLRLGKGKPYRENAPHLELWAPAFGVKDVFDLFYARWVLVGSLFRLFLDPVKKIKHVPKGGGGGGDLDLESGEKGFFPIVLIQIPMCNVKEVYQQFIATVCNLDWPKSNFLIQVLDDSDDPIT
ncbi:hypothetical protein RYX36_036969 [Vicia faba]